MLVLPFILLAGLLIFGLKHKSFYLLTAFFLLGLVVAILPWLTHNYLLTGKLTFDSPSQYKVIASQYAYTGNLDIGSVDLEGKSLGGILFQFVLKDPAFVFGFIANHFLATQINGILALPLIKPFNGLFEPINLYWMNWDGSLEWYNLALIVFYLVIIAMGFAAAWKRWRWLGLLPLGFSMGYALATAVGRFSGWRYDLPADWVWYFYFGIGFAELLLHVALLFGVNEEQVFPRVELSNFIVTTRHATSTSYSTTYFQRAIVCLHWFSALAGTEHCCTALCGSISRYIGRKNHFAYSRADDGRTGCICFAARYFCTKWSFVISAFLFSK